MAQQIFSSFQWLFRICFWGNVNRKKLWITFGFAFFQFLGKEPESSWHPSTRIVFFSLFLPLGKFELSMEKKNSQDFPPFRRLLARNWDVKIRWAFELRKHRAEEREIVKNQLNLFFLHFYFCLRFSPSFLFSFWPVSINRIKHNWFGWWEIRTKELKSIDFMLFFMYVECVISRYLKNRTS